MFTFQVIFIFPTIYLLMSGADQKEEITLLFQGFGVAGNIFISNGAAASNKSLLQKHQIAAVISAGKGLWLPHSKVVLPNYLYIPVNDSESENIYQFFDVTYSFIEKNRKNVNVLVHCYSGISRSATLIAAYLIRKYGYSMSQTIKMLRQKRKKINPNRGFIRQLYQYQSELKGISIQRKNNIRQTLSCVLGSLKEKTDLIQEQIKKATLSVHNSREKRDRSKTLRLEIEEGKSKKANGRRKTIFCDGNKMQQHEKYIKQKLVQVI